MHGGAWTTAPPVVQPEASSPAGEERRRSSAQSGGDSIASPSSIGCRGGKRIDQTLNSGSLAWIRRAPGANRRSYLAHDSASPTLPQSARREPHQPLTGPAGGDDCTTTIWFGPRSDLPSSTSWGRFVEGSSSPAQAAASADDAEGSSVQTDVAIYHASLLDAQDELWRRTVASYRGVRIRRSSRTGSGADRAVQADALLQSTLASNGRRARTRRPEHARRFSAATGALVLGSRQYAARERREGRGMRRDATRGPTWPRRAAVVGPTPSLASRWPSLSQRSRWRACRIESANIRSLGNWQSRVARSSRGDVPNLSGGRLKATWKPRVRNTATGAA